MTDVDTIIETLECLADWVRTEYANAAASRMRDALEALDRLAARVGESWCFDMERAHREGTRFIAITKGGIQRIDRMHSAQASSAKHFWEEVPNDPYVAWRSLPPPPESTDGR